MGRWSSSRRSIASASRVPGSSRAIDPTSETSENRGAGGTRAARRPPMTSRAEQRILDGSTWRDFCRALEKAGDTILRPGTPATAFDRAEGIRYLTRLLRASLESQIESSDPCHPRFFQLSNDTIKIGNDNPDNIYHNCNISGRYDYRIRGTRGTVPYLSFGTKAGSYDRDAEMRPTGQIDGRHMQVAPDGSFEILVSRNKQAGNWLPMEESSEGIIVRQTFDVREGAVPAYYEIECLNPGDREHADALDPLSIEAGARPRDIVRDADVEPLHRLDGDLREAPEPAALGRSGSLPAGRWGREHPLPPELLEARARPGPRDRDRSHPGGGDLELPALELLDGVPRLPPPPDPHQPRNGPLRARTAASGSWWPAATPVPATRTGSTPACTTGAACSSAGSAAATTIRRSRPVSSASRSSRKGRAERMGWTGGQYSLYRAALAVAAACAVAAVAALLRNRRHVRSELPALRRDPVRRHPSRGSRAGARLSGSRGGLHPCAARREAPSCLRAGDRDPVVDGAPDRAGRTRPHRAARPPCLYAARALRRLRRARAGRSARRLAAAGLDDRDRLALLVVVTAAALFVADDSRIVDRPPHTTRPGARGRPRRPARAERPPCRLERARALASRRRLRVRCTGWRGEPSAPDRLRGRAGLVERALPSRSVGVRPASPPVSSTTATADSATAACGSSSRRSSRHPPHCGRASRLSEVSRSPNDSRSTPSSTRRRSPTASCSSSKTERSSRARRLPSRSRRGWAASGASSP